MKELKPKHLLVARYMALGLSLKDICARYHLNYKSWQQTVRGDLFKAKVAELVEEIETNLVESVTEDPVLLKLKAAAGSAVDVLVTEMENVDEDTGASAATRISAADKLLKKAGYDSGMEEDKSAIINISLSQDMLDAVKISGKIAKQPDQIKE